MRSRNDLEWISQFSYPTFPKEGKSWLDMERYFQDNKVRMVQMQIERRTLISYIL